MSKLVCETWAENVRLPPSLLGGGSIAGVDDVIEGAPTDTDTRKSADMNRAISNCASGRWGRPLDRRV